MIAQELEVSLHMAFVEARQKRHEFITVEHLLLALLDNPTAAEVLRACGANMDELRKNLSQHIAEQTPRIAADREVCSAIDRKSTRLNSSHMSISYAVFCLKKKKKTTQKPPLL